MRYYIDIDGTLTDSQRRWAEPVPAMIDAVRALIDVGHEVVIWSGATRYARDWCAKNAVEPIAALGKPQVIVDNETRRFRRMLTRRIQSPAQFMEGNNG